MVHTFTFYVCFDYDSTPVHNLLSWSHREKGMWIEMIHFQNFWNFYQSYVWTCLSPPLRNIRKNIFRHKNLVGSQVTVYYSKWEKVCRLELQLVYLGRFPWTEQQIVDLEFTTKQFHSTTKRTNCPVRCARGHTNELTNFHQLYNAPQFPPLLSMVAGWIYNEKSSEGVGPTILKHSCVFN